MLIIVSSVQSYIMKMAKNCDTITAVHRKTDAYSFSRSLQILSSAMKSILRIYYLITIISTSLPLCIDKILCFHFSITFTICASYNTVPMTYAAPTSENIIVGVFRAPSITSMLIKNSLSVI